jgi:hypothetical protein
MVFLFARPRRLFYFPFALNSILHTSFKESCFMCDDSSTIGIFPLFLILLYTRVLRKVVLCVITPHPYGFSLCFYPTLHTSFKESCFMCDYSSTIWIFPLFLILLYTRGLGKFVLCVMAPQPYGFSLCF